MRSTTLDVKILELVMFRPWLVARCHLAFDCGIWRLGDHLLAMQRAGRQSYTFNRDMAWNTPSFALLYAIPLGL